MRKRQAAGMQSQSRSIAVVDGWLAATRSAIDAITANRVTRLGKVNPNLVRPPGFQSAVDE